MDQVEAAESRHLDDRPDQERRVEELHVDPALVAPRQPARGPKPRVSVVGVVVGLALVGHLEVVHEARCDQIPSVVRLLGIRQLGERPVGDAEDVAGDLHEPRRLTHFGSQCRIRPRDPVQRLVQMSVDIDDAHLIPPLLAPNLPNGGGRASATSPPFVLAGVVGTTCPVERVELCHVLVGE